MTNQGLFIFRTCLTAIHPTDMLRESKGGELALHPLQRTEGDGLTYAEQN